MIEIGLGLGLVLGALVILAGAGDTLGLPVADLFPLIGCGGTGFILALGLLLIASGVSRRVMQRHHEKRQKLRTARLTTAATLATATLAVGLPFTAAALNLVRVEGFPLGYYMAAQGALILLAAIAFVWAGQQNAIDAEHSDHE